MWQAVQLSAGEARRILINSLGLGSAPGTKRPTKAAIESAMRGSAPLQLDTVNVFERAHYLPLFSRLGSYDKSILESLAFAERSPFTEYWAHEAAIIPIADWPLWGWKMTALRDRDHADAQWVSENKRMLDWLRDHLKDAGPLRASEIDHADSKRSGPWWGWSKVKTGLEYLFRWGEVAVSGRERFERRYGIVDAVLPAEVLARPVARPEAIRALVERSAAHLGIATTADLADVFRLRNDDTAVAVRDLCDAGVIVPARVAGWRQPAWLHRDAAPASRVSGAALLSPFDPLIWDRKRLHRHFDFHYRIEIYTPAEKRQFGYYCLPILLDERLVGRIDLKSDRQRRELLVQAAWWENSASEAADTANDLVRIAELVRSAAEWQGLATVRVVDRGTLATDLTRALV